MKILDFSEYNYSNRKEIKKCIDAGQYFVAVEKEIAGAMILILDENSCQIRAIASGKKGAGRLLVNFAIDKCKKEGIPKLWCWSLARRKAEGFYEKMGFEEKLLMRKQWLGEDCWIFGKVTS